MLPFIMWRPSSIAFGENQREIYPDDDSILPTDEMLLMKKAVYGFLARPFIDSHWFSDRNVQLKV